MAAGDALAQLADPPARVRPWLTARWPALPVVVSLIGGILLHDHLTPRVGLWLLVAASLAVTALFMRPAWMGSACLAVAVFGVGLAAAQVARFGFADDHIAQFTGPEPRIAGLELRLVEPPRLLRTPESAMPRAPKLSCLAEVTAVNTWHGWQPTGGRALLQFDNPVPDLRAGDRIRVLGLLERPGEAMNPGQFDYAAYYRAQGVLASISVDGPAMVTRLGHDAPAPLVGLREHAHRWLVAGFAARDLEHAAVLRALVLGESDPVMSDARDAFRKSGTSHHLAISGLHIAIVGGLVFGALRLLGAGPRASLVCGVGAIVLYGVLAMPSAPVIRATVLAAAFGAGLLAGRRGPAGQMLSVAAVVVLLLNPLDLYRAGFQLTFVSVLGLMLFADGLARWMAGGRDGDDAARLRRARLAIRLTAWLDRRMVAAVAAGVVAWFVAMPLIAVHFEQFNPWAIPASIAVAPFVLASLVAGVLKILLTAAAPGQAALWAAGAAAPVRWMQGVVNWFAARPWADVPLPAPSVPLLILTYAALALWLVRIRPVGVRWAARALFPALCFVVFILPYASAAPSVAVRPLRVTVLAVGAGQCVVIETPGGRVAMIDAGSSSLGDPVDKCVAPFLRSRGYARVELLALSHANWDHYGGAAELARRYGVDEILIAEQFEADARVFASGRQVLDELAHLDRRPRVVRVGDRVPLGRQTTLEVLWPPADARDLSSNDASLVVKVTHAGRSILFSGDIQEEAMRRLLRLNADSPGLLKADVLVAPHHGSSEPSTAAFVEAVDPAYVVSSNGRALSQKQRRFEELVGGRPLLRTHKTGAVTVEIADGGALAIETFLGSGPRTLHYPE